MNRPISAPENPYLTAIEATEIDTARLSKLAVLSLALAILPCLLMLFGAIVCTVLWVPPLGLLIAILGLAPLALVTLSIQSLAWGAASTAKQRIERDPTLRGVGLCWVARGIALFQGVLACLLLGLVVGIPTFIVTAEAMAWRSVATRGVTVAEETVVEIRELRVGVQTELQRVAQSMESLSKSGDALAGEVRLMNQNTSAMSGSLESLVKESEAWRVEIAAIREMDLWVWCRDALSRSFASMANDTNDWKEGRPLESITEEAFRAKQ